MTEKVLIYSRFPRSALARFAARYDLLDSGGKPLAEAFTAEQLAGVRALVTAGGTPLGADAIARLPSLGAIICYGTGYDGVDVEAAAARNIAIGNSPGANASSEIGRASCRERV